MRIAFIDSVFFSLRRFPLQQLAAHPGGGFHPIEPGRRDDTERNPAKIDGFLAAHWRRLEETIHAGQLPILQDLGASLAKVSGELLLVVLADRR